MKTPDRPDQPLAKYWNGKYNEIQVLLISYSQKKVLLRTYFESWILPGFLQGENKCFESCIEPGFISKKLREVVGMNGKVGVLRLVWKETRAARTPGLDGAPGTTYLVGKAVLLMECLEEVQVLPEFRWVCLSQANVFHVINAAALAIGKELKLALMEFEPEERLQWQRHGWFKNAACWMEQVLGSSQNTELTEPVFQLRSSGYGAVLQANTTKGSFFF